VVYKDAVEYEEAGWLSQYSIKPSNFEDQIDILSVGIVKLFWHASKTIWLSNYCHKLLLMIHQNFVK